MSNYKMNSHEYWDDRFNTDWIEYGGNEQTRFFAKTLCQMLPEWLVHEINESKAAICDLGCAEGDALAIYQQTFMTSKIYGEDFSQKAIDNAKDKYPEYGFKISDILNPEHEEKYPVVICSNVVEHFKETYRVLSKVCERATKYSIIMIPYREAAGAIDEHEKSFCSKDIPMFVDGNKLVYAKSVQCNSIYYPYEQLLLVYSKDDKFSVMSEIIENVSSDRETEKEECLKQCEDKISECELKLEESNAHLSECREQNNNYTRQIDDYIKQIEECKKQNKDNIRKFEECQKQIESLERKNEDYVRQIKSCEQNKDSELEALAGQVTQLQQQYQMALAIIRQKDEYMMQTQQLCNHYATGKLAALNHFAFRIKGQWIRGNKEDRKAFKSWLKGRIKKTNRNIGDGVIYNPWMVVNEKLREALACRVPAINSIGITSVVGNNVQSGTNYTNENADIQMLPIETKHVLKADYTKYDVIILSVIDYNFRHQRPQHFATRFAANGHRVFYVNANFIRSDSIYNEQENLYVVDFDCKEFNTIYVMEGKDSLDWMKGKFGQLIYNQGIRDAIVVVDYPNWVYGAEFLKEHYGFKIVTDYMDDYTGFLGTAEDFLKNNCIRLLSSSDAVVASSQFLYDVASKYTDVEKITIVRNGTEVDHFYQAVNLQNKDKVRKVIGYYGAVAHWFAADKVCYLAKKFPECDIVIVGDVTEYRNELERHNNIKLLGEKSYKELPNYLADFDVCLIPFDTSTDLIKATNPVKFYEYLSAGKKVVATEIPELMPFKDEYVYMSNDDAKFAEYVKLCLDEQDSLKGKDECIEFAKENDWQKRYECFEEASSAVVPKVSVIVLTYNNLELNKRCINSILKKTAYANYELIIVDNQSTDGTIEYLKELEQEQISNVKIIFNDVNSGFAGGNNLGIQAATGEYVLLLNNDTLVTRGWLTAMTKHLENNPDYGMCNPVTNSIGNESMIKVNYHGEADMHEFAYNYTAHNMNVEYHDVDRLPLFATMIRKSVIDKAGMLDSDYKVGMFEDDDFTAAVKAAGYDIVIVDDAFIHHVNNASFKKLSDEEYKKIFDANKAIYEKKWNKKWAVPKYREGVMATDNVDCKI